MSFISLTSVFQDTFRRHVFHGAFMEDIVSGVKPDSAETGWVYTSFMHYVILQETFPGVINP